MDADLVTAPAVSLIMYVGLVVTLAAAAVWSPCESRRQVAKDVLTLLLGGKAAE
jgi:hypothetical protein